jgi:hypothetical protein
MKFIKVLLAVLLSSAIIACALLSAVLWRGYQIASISETVAKNHLVEKGNGAAWPVKITGLLGEISKTSDSVRISADTMKRLLAEQGQRTAQSVQTTAAALSKSSANIYSVLAEEGPETAKSVRDAAAGLAGTSRTVQSILTHDGPATAKSVRDAAASIAGAAATVQTTLADEAPATAKSIRDVADTAQKVLAEEGPRTAASIRQTTESAAALSGSWANISKALDSWVERLTAPPTVKQQIAAFFRVVIMALSHLL